MSTKKVIEIIQVWFMLSLIIMPLTGVIYTLLNFSIFSREGYNIGSNASDKAYSDLSNDFWFGCFLGEILLTIFIVRHEKYLSKEENKADMSNKD